MKRICIAVVSTLVLATSFSQSQADSKPAGKGSAKTRGERSRVFPADVVDSKINSSESAEFFPADRVKRTAAVRTEIRLREDRPVFPLRTASQPPPAPASEGHFPPSPSGANPMPMPANTTPKPMPGSTQVDGGFSAPFDKPEPQLLEVEQVFSDPAAGCDECGCDDWCHRHCWLRSTGDMPARDWYRPEKHGYYSFRPYNYRHVLQHSQFAPILGAAPKAPYETGMFEKFYAGVPDIDKFEPEKLKPKDDEDAQLPLIEDLLSSPKKMKKEAAKPTAKKAAKLKGPAMKMPPQPPLPMNKGDAKKKPATKKP